MQGPAIHVAGETGLLSRTAPPWPVGSLLGRERPRQADTPPPLGEQLSRKWGPPHLWDGSSLGARKLRGEPLPQHPSPDAQAGKAAGFFLWQAPPEIWLPWYIPRHAIARCPGVDFFLGL